MNARTDVGKAARGMAAIARSSVPDDRLYPMVYLALYTCGYSGRGSLAKFEAVAHALVDTAFVAGLLREVDDRRSETGWTVTGWNGERVFLKKDSIAAFAPRRDVVGRVGPKGSRATLSVPALEPGRRPGFVLRQGAELPEGPVSRLYLNIGAGAASWALGDLARALDRAEIPFLSKVLAHPRAYLRRDACVVYTNSASFEAAVDVVTRALATSRVRLRNGVPRFTQRLALGIGHADDLAERGIGELSYGQWVCGHLLRAAADTEEPKELARLVTRSIAASGRDPERPYLRPK